MNEHTFQTHFRRGLVLQKINPLCFPISLFFFKMYPGKYRQWKITGFFSRFAETIKEAGFKR